MKLVEFKTQGQSKIHRKLGEGWFSREQLAEHMFMSERQISCLLSTLRNKGIAIKSRPIRNYPKKKEYALGEEGDFQVRKVNPNDNVLLVMEMNHIRLISEKNGYDEIRRIAERALEGCGLLTETTVFD